MHDWEDPWSRSQSPERHLPGGVEQVGVAGHRHAAAEHLRRLPSLHHDDQQVPPDNMTA